MNTIVGGFENMVWRIIGYDGLEEISQQTYSLKTTDQAKIEALLKELASQHLTFSEVAAGFADVRIDESNGNRVMLSAGENPHYVASLWRADEL